MTYDAMLSSNSVEWSTPTDLFEKLDSEFHFNLDPCATEDNAKCSYFFTKETDGLTQDWGGVSCVLQSALRKNENSKMGRKSLFGKPKARHTGGVPCPSANRYRMVPPFCPWEGRDQISERTAKLWKWQWPSTFSIYAYRI